MDGIDRVDEEILNVIKFNARLSGRQIAKKTGIPVATANRRLKHMINNGIINKFVTDINYDKLGKKTIAFVLIRASPGANQFQILEEAAKFDIVEDMAALTGQFDILLKIRVKDNEELTEFIFKKMKPLPQVSQTETFITLKLKDDKKKKV